MSGGVVKILALENGWDVCVEHRVVPTVSGINRPTQCDGDSEIRLIFQLSYAFGEWDPT